jgi:hypothetical protein
VSDAVDAAVASCAAEPSGTLVTLATGLSLPAYLAVDAQFIYWLDQGTYGGTDGAVKKVPLCGGAVVTLASTLPWPDALALDATDVYWANGTGRDGAILKVAKSGGAVTTLATQVYASGLAVGGSYAYWGTIPTMAIFRVPVAGGATEVVVPGNDSEPGGELFLDGASVYFTTGAYTIGAVIAAPAEPTSGGAVVTLASARNTPQSVVVQGPLVYWTEAADDTGYLGNVMAVPVAGGAPITIAAGEEINLEGLAVDASYVYWTNVSDVSVGNVMKAPLGGGAEVVVAAEPQGYPGWVAVDDTYVYWTTQEATGSIGSIVRMSK